MRLIKEPVCVYVCLRVCVCVHLRVCVCVHLHVCMWYVGGGGGGEGTDADSRFVYFDVGCLSLIMTCTHLGLT